MDQLREFLIEFFGDAVKKVYIQPPTGKQMEYPCITITRDPGSTSFADNKAYRHQERYRLTGIKDDPEGLYDLLKELPRSRHERSYPAENLTHDVFSIFF